MKQHDSGYHMIKFEGIPIAEFIVKEIYTEREYTVEGSVQYFATQEEVQQIIKQLEDKSLLKPCSFCGSDASLKETNIYGVSGVRACCLKCHISTMSYQEGFTHGMNEETRHTIAECKGHAISAWNTRTD